MDENAQNITLSIGDVGFARRLAGGVARTRALSLVQITSHFNGSNNAFAEIRRYLFTRIDPTNICGGDTDLALLLSISNRNINGQSRRNTDKARK